VARNNSFGRRGGIRVFFKAIPMPETNEALPIEFRGICRLSVHQDVGLTQRTHNR
jgi:hypothetical protein